MPHTALGHWGLQLPRWPQVDCDPSRICPSEQVKGASGGHFIAQEPTLGYLTCSAKPTRHPQWGHQQASNQQPHLDTGERRRSVLRLGNMGEGECKPFRAGRAVKEVLQP